MIAPTQDAVANAINAASYRAANLVYDYAATFTERERYEPLDLLASRVQREVVETACRILKEGESHE